MLNQMVSFPLRPIYHQGTSLKPIGWVGPNASPALVTKERDLYLPEN
jgi:hypothetical protein